MAVPLTSPGITKGRTTAVLKWRSRIRRSARIITFWQRLLRSRMAARKLTPLTCWQATHIPTACALITAMGRCRITWTWYFALSLGDGPSVTAYAADYSPDETSYDVVAEWSPPTGGDSSGVTGYQLQYRATLRGPGWISLPPVDANTEADLRLGARNRDLYQVRVSARHADGTSSNWNYAEATAGGPTTTTDGGSPRRL